MAMLGDLLAGARASAGEFQAWLLDSDPALAKRLVAAAAQMGVGPAGYARIAVADFSRYASEEDWATLTSSLRSATDPGTICLLAMVHWRLTVPACGAHSDTVDHGGEANDQSPGRP